MLVFLENVYLFISIGSTFRYTLPNFRCALKNSAMSQLPLNYDCFWTNASSMGCAWGFESDDDEVVRQKFCFPQLPIMILLTPTKGSYSYFVKLPLKRERYNFFSTECNLFKVLTKYLTGNCLLHGVIEMATVLVVLGNWLDRGVCLHGLDSGFLPLELKLFSFTLGVLHLSEKPVNSPSHWLRAASFPGGKP